MKKHFDLLRGYGHATTVATTACATPILSPLFKTGFFKEWLPKNSLVLLVLLTFFCTQSVFGQQAVNITNVNPASEEICSDGTVSLTATVTGGTSSVRWKVIGNTGTFSDSLSTTTIYTPNPVTGTTLREDEVVVVIEEEFPIEWETSTSTTIDVDGSSPIDKASVTATETNVGENGASSINLLGMNQDGWVETTVANLDKSLLTFGLSANPERSYTGVDFGIILIKRANGERLIVATEDGDYQGLGTYVPPVWGIGSVLRVERREGAILYSFDGTVFYISEQTSTSELKVDVGLVYEDEVIENLEASFDDGSSTARLTDSRTIMVHPAPSVDLGRDTFVCLNDPVVLDVTIAQAANSPSFSVVTGSGTFETPNSNGEYTYTPMGSMTTATRDDVIRISHAGTTECSATMDEITVTVTQPEDISKATPDPISSVCEGGTIELEYALMQASIGKTVTWSVVSPAVGTFSYPNGVNDPVVEYTPSVISSVTGARTDIIRATIQNPSDCGDTFVEFMVPVEKAAIVQISTVDPTIICTDATTTIEVDVDVIFGGGATGFNITSSGGSFTPTPSSPVTTTPSTFTFDPEIDLNTVVSGMETITVETTPSGGLCPVATDVLEVEVYLQPEITNIIPNNPLINRCDGTTFNVRAEGNVDFTWTEKNNNGSFTIFNANNNTFTYQPNPLGSLTERYDTLIVTSITNGTCLPVSEMRVVRFFQKPTLDLGGDQTLCEGESVTLSPVFGGSATSIDNALTMNINGGTYDANNMVFTSDQVSLANESQTLILGTNSNGPCAAATDEVVFTVFDKPDVEITSPAGAVVGTGTIPQINRCETTTFNIVFRAEVAGAAVPFTWGAKNNAGTLTEINTTTYSYTPNPLGALTERYDTLFVTSMPNGDCALGSDSLVVRVWKAATLDLGIDQTICEDDVALITPIVGGSVIDLDLTNNPGNPPPNGTGTFDTNTGIYTYTPTAPTGGNRDDVLTFETADPAGNACAAVTETITITVEENDEIDLLTGATGTTIATSNNKFVCEDRPVLIRTQLDGAAPGKNVGWANKSGNGTYEYLNTDSTEIRYTPIADANFPADEVRWDTLIATVKSSTTCDAAQLEVYVNVRKANILPSIDDVTMCLGETQLLMVEPSGGISTLTWTLDPDGTNTVITGSVNTANTLLDSIDYTPVGPITGSRVDEFEVVAEGFGVCPDITQTFNVTVLESPVVDITSAAGPFCETETIPLTGTATGTTSIKWSMQNSLNGNIIESDDLTNAMYVPVPITGTDLTRVDRIYLTGNSTNGGCDAAIDSIDITIERIPFLTEVRDTFVCEGGMLDLEVILEGSATEVYWTKMGVGFIDNPAPDITTGQNVYNAPARGTITGSAMAELQLETDMPNSCPVFKDTIHIIAYETPEVLINGSAQSGGNASNARFICQDNPLTLNGTTNGSDGITWSMRDPSLGAITNANNITGAVYTPVAFTNADLTRTDRIYLTATSLSGSCDPAIDSIDVVVRRPQTIEPIRDTFVCEGGMIDLSAVTGGSTDMVNWANLTITGDFGSVPNTSSNDVKYTANSNLSVAFHVDEIEVSVSSSFNGACSVIKDTFEITVYEVPEVHINGSDKDPNVTNATNEDFTCQDTPLPLMGTESNTNGIAWSMKNPSLGTITDPTDLTAATYVPAAFTNADLTRTDTIYLTAESLSGNCEPARDSIFVVVQAPPTIEPINDTTVCVDSRIDLSAITGGSANTITWTKAGVGSFVAPNTGNMVTFRAPNPAANNVTDSAMVTVTVTVVSDFSPTCSNKTEEFEITVHQIPTAIINGSDKDPNVANSTNVDFTCQDMSLPLSGTAPNSSSVVWSMKNPSLGTITDPTDLTGATYIPAAFTNADITRTDTIYLTAESLSGNCDPDRDSIYVVVRRPQTLEPINDTIVCVDSEIDLMAITGGSTNTITWTRTGVGSIVAPGTGNMVTYRAPTTAAANVTDSAMVTATVTVESDFSNACPDIMEEFEIKVYEPASVAIDNNPVIYTTNATSGNLTTTICSSSTLNLEGENLSGASGITWSMADPTLGSISDPNDLTAAVYTPNPLTGTDQTRTDILYLTAHSFGNCDPVVIEIEVVVENAPTISLAGPTMVCQGEEIEITATQGGGYTGNVRWIDNAANNIMADQSDASGVENSLLTYTPAAGGIVPRTDLIIARARASSAACTNVRDTLEVQILEADGVTINTTPNAPVCEGSSIDLSATLSGAATALVWTVDAAAGTILNPNSSTPTFVPSPILTGNTRADVITVTTIPTSGCEPATAMITINVRKATEVTLGQDITVCEDVTSNIITATINSPDVNVDMVSWDLLSNGTRTTFTGGTTPTTLDYTMNRGLFQQVNAPDVMRLDTIIAVSEIPTGICMAVEDTIVVTVVDASDITANGMTTGTVQIFACEGDVVDLEAAIVSGATSVTWELLAASTGNGTIADANSLVTTYTPVNIAGTAITRTDQLKVIANDLGGCPPEEILVNVIVRKPPSLSMIADESLCDVGNPTVTLSTTVSGGANTDPVFNLINDDNTTTLITPVNDNSPEFSVDYNPADLAAPRDQPRIDLIEYSVQSQFSICDAFVDTVAVTIIEASDITVNGMTSGTVQIFACEGEVVDLEAAIVSGATSVTWELLATSTGNGAIADANSLVTTYTPSNIAGTAITRTDQLKVTANDLGVCAPEEILVNVIVRKPPSLATIDDVSLCDAGSPTVILSTISSGGANNGTVAFNLLNDDGSKTAQTQIAPAYTIDYDPNPLAPVDQPRVDLIEYSVESQFLVCDDFVDTVAVTVFPNPELEIVFYGQPDGEVDLDTLVVCEGDMISIAAIANAGVPDILWTAENGTFTDATALTTEYIPDVGQTVNTRWDTIFINAPTATGCAPVEQDTLLVRVRRAPNLTAIPDANVCEDGMLSLSATAIDLGTGNNNNDISWELLNNGPAGDRILNTVGGVVTVASGTSITYDPSTAGTAEIRYFTTDPVGICPMEEDTVVVTVHEESLITVPTNILNVCEGESITINASFGGGATSIEWTGGNGAFSASTNPVTDYTPITGLTTDFRDDILIISSTNDAPGCDPIQETVTVRVHRATGLTTATPRTVCLNTPATLSAQSTGIGTDVSWIILEGTGTLSQSTTSGTETTEYTPTGAINGTSRIDTIQYATVNPNSPCLPTVKKVAVTVYPESIVDAGPTIIDVCEGETITLNGTFSGGGTGVIWTGGNGTIASPNNPVTDYTPSTGLTTDTREDILTITTVNNAPSCDAAEDMIIVRVQRQTGLTDATEGETCLGAAVPMNAQSTGFGNSVIWTVIHGTGNFNGNASTTTVGSQSADYTPTGSISGATRVDTLQYSSQTPTGCEPTIKKVAVIVHGNDVVEVADPTVENDTVYVCFGSSVPLDGGYDAGITSAAWSVINNTGTITGVVADTIATYTPNVITTGTQRIDKLVLTGQSSSTICPTVTDTLVVIVEKTPDLATVPDSIAMCEGSMFTLNATASANIANLTWTPKVASNGIVSGASGTSANYEPVGTISGIFREDIIYVTSTNSTNTCPSVRDSVKVLVAAKPQLELGPDQTLCVNGGNIIVPQLLGAGNQLTWTANDGTVDENNAYHPEDPFPAVVRQDVVSAVAIDSFGLCTTSTVSDFIAVTVTETVEIQIANNQTVCEDEILIIDNNYSGSTANFTASVLNDNGTISLTNGQIIFEPKENIGATTRTDRIVITNNDVDGPGICTAFSDTVFVNVLNAPRATLVGDLAICEGEVVNLLVETFGRINEFSSKYSNSLVNYPSNPPVLTGGPVIDTVVYATSSIDGSCISARDTVFVTIQPVGTYALALPDTSICEVNTLALNSGITDQTAVHTWTVVGGNGTFDNASSPTPVYSPNMGLTTTSRVDMIILKVEQGGNSCFTNTDTMLVTIIQGATFTPLPDTAICVGETVAVDLALSGAADLVWSSSNGTFSSVNTSATVYTPSALTGTSRIDTLHADLTFPGGGCADIRETMLVVIYDALPISVGQDTSICGGFDFQLDGTLGFGLNDATWSVLGGTGTFNDSSLLNAIYTPDAVTGTEVRVDTLVLNASSGLSCLNGADTILLTIKLTPTVSLGADRTVFNGTNVSLMATLDEKVEVSRWSSNNGSFLNSGLDVSTYVPNDLGTLESRVDRVIYEATFSNATCVNVLDTVLITVMAPPSISRGGNSAFCESICLDTTFVNIDNNTRTAVVLANNIDPFDTCQVRSDLDLRFWYPGLGTAEPTTVMDFPALPNNVTYDCDDRGLQNINVYVAEDSMNIQLCPVVIQVEDAGLSCGERTVSGRITTFRGEPVEGFDVFVEDMGEVGGVVPDPVKTDADGRYTFVLDINRSYRIVPRNDEDLSMGVTAFDNVVISRHILGLQAFDSPFQTIAADVNKSGTVTAFDIVLIRKVVLARDDQFLNNTSWRFIDADYVFEDVASAASAPFMESFVIEENTGNISSMNFIAVKTGDPNGTADPNGLTSIADDRNASNNRLLETHNLAIEKGQVYEVPFRFIDGNELSSYQFTMDFDGLELLDIQGGVATPEHFGQTMTKRGLLTAAWSSAESVEGDRTWFTLKFKANKSGMLSELLSLNSVVTPIEAVTTDEENVGIQLTFVQSNTTALELFQNKPNPFKTATTIGFALPESGNATITVLDMQGRVFKTIKGDYAAGYNQVAINFTDLPKGVFYYRLETAFGTRVQKMMSVE